MHELASRALFADQTQHIAEPLLTLRGWTVVTVEFPVFEVRFEHQGRTSLGVRMQCGDWNDRPPSVTLLDGSGTPLVVGSAPTGSNIFHQGPHDSTRLPFVCMAGTLEYHTQSSHVGDSWENYRTRSGFDLGGILTQVWNGWLKCTT